MSEEGVVEDLVKIPEFKTQEDFRDWVKSLDDKQIQSFKTKDWLSLYDNLDKYTKANNIDPNGFTCENKEFFATLYRNYRFEPEQSRYIREIARKAGEELAKDPNIDPAKLAIETDFSNGRPSEILNTTRKINDITASTTSYEEGGNPYTEVLVKDIGSTTYGDAAYYSREKISRIRMNSRTLTDGVLNTAAHESAHINFQTQTPTQQHLLEQGIAAHQELGTDFQKLMLQNKRYYLHFSVFEEDCKSLYEKLPPNEARQAYRKLFNGCIKEPMERLSNLYGHEFERAYRKSTGHYSERNAKLVSNYLAVPSPSLPPPPPVVEGEITNQISSNPPQTSRVSVGLPSECKSVDGGVKLTYSTNGDCSVADLEKLIRDKLTKGDKSVADLLDIKTNNTFGNVSFVVPNSYDFTSKFNDFIRTTPPPPPLPPRPKVDTQEPKAQTQTPNPNIEAAMDAAPKEKASSLDLILEKSGRALNDNAVGRFVQKANDWRPKNKVAAKAVDKVGMVPASAAVAGAALAYEQYKETGDIKAAAGTFGKSMKAPVIQMAAMHAGTHAVAKGAEKITEKVVTHQAVKSASKTAARAAEKAAAKATAKAAGKAAGKAVGKSVLKKIPLVSLAAGGYFAYERAKKGEWLKAGGELLSGALGCLPGLGTAASTAIDCGLAYSDVKQTINETKKQQVQSQQQAQNKPIKDNAKAQQIQRLRTSNSNTKRPVQKTQVNQQTIAKASIERD